MSLPHNVSRDDEGKNARVRRRGIRGDADTSRRRRFVGEELAGQLIRDSYGSSRRSADVHPSLLVMDHHSDACAGSYPYCPHAGCKTTYRMEAATSAPACTDANASSVTWQGDTRQTFHYHHHFYHHDWPSGSTNCSHAYHQTVYCCGLKTSHDCGGSHGGPPINYPVNISAPISGPAKPDPVPTSQSMRFTRHMQDEEDLYAAEEEEPLSSSAPAADAPLCSPEHALEDAHAAAQEASPLKVFKAGPLPAHLTHCRQLPPFPSSHASPYLLCQHCSRLLSLPQGVILFPPPGIRRLQSFLLVKLKCGYCLKVSKFSTRHIHIRSSEPLPQSACSGVPPIPTSLPSCSASNGVMQEPSVCNHDVAEEAMQERSECPLNESALKSESVILTNGSVEGNLQQKIFEAGSPLYAAYTHAPNTNYIEYSEPLNGIPKNLLQCKDVATHTLGNAECVHVEEDVFRTEESLRGDIAQSKNVGTGAIQNGMCVHSEELVIETDPLDGTWKKSAQSEHVSDIAQSRNVVTIAIQNGTCVHSKEIVFEAESLNGTCEKAAQSKHVSDVTQSKNVGTGAIQNGTCVHIEEIVIETEPLHGTCKKSAQAKHVSGIAPLKTVEVGAIQNGTYAHSEEIFIEAESLNGTCEKASQPKHAQTDLLMNDKCQEIISETLEPLSTDCVQPAKDDDKEAGAPNHKEISQLGVWDSGAMLDSHSDKEQEIAAFSSVQDWVDSLSMEIGYESDNRVDGHLDCPNECIDGLKRFPSSGQRPALHQHFGYGSPSELFEKVLFSEDEEIKARTETNSTASSSFSSNNASQPTQSKSQSAQVHAPSLRSWSFTPDVSGVIDATELNGRRSWVGLLRKTGRSFLSPSSKPKVVVNGHVLSTGAVKQAEERAGKLRPGSYWYDYRAGFWGVEGGPCLGILPPYIEELNYPMTNYCSNGDTQVRVNGRELHAKDLTLLSQRGLSQKSGRAYVLGFDGVLIDETTGLELKHLGKLAPTVHQRGKGFGMFNAGVLQSKTGTAHQIKPLTRFSNSSVCT